MKLSARNQYEGTVVNVEVGPVSSKVVLDIGGGKTISSTISTDSFKELDIKKGDTLVAIVKATSVILGK
ncbi:TOBE domain-containing protein [Ethanoligenens harbinense]|uniref:TOBE domain-containing protein n=1 Tax=Ethanoligenens harbinense (strain DSM 18485 / JCM 12961 / CGMCC 1.5033 / YUAN-3) TaxID=663278 RepID=E6U886_ETHHY|nr:TOBE domain-containing protein [Ethanoligenens harbinense]ADU27105.1 TOBE domain-containing protein [Ethanoligenens harbinense YUAN-3]AVQ96181.1 molybdenum-pterin-binding protein [Ethanoligenens harbinense YUAN-3]AYF38841.1 molybdenum-pterin-binding protein [Ethanoligenens harbinense]AYF41591.1 molybdenum-pterin-binding protein [Ethanoligenens harbinense]QCN92422.1 molybdenum-pterin-binding protein [Ethanoligenens harbinense]